MANYFTDRVVQHPGRITLTATGGSDEYDVDRAEGTVTTAGTPFNASTFNGMLDTYGAWYGTCSTAAGTQTKVVTCSGFTLVTGSFLVVKFDSGNTYNGRIKLNVNSTGAKDVYDLGQYSGDNYYCYFEDGGVMIFQYDGTQFRICNSAIITNAELTALESALSITTSTGGRLYDVLDTLATNVSYSQDTYDNTNMRTGSATATRYGKVVNFFSSNDFKALTGGGAVSNTWVTLDSQYRPPGLVTGLCTNNKNYWIVIYVNYLGEVTFQNLGSTFSSAQNGAFNMTWIV